MKTKWTVDTLNKFEEQIADIYNKGKIRFPIHLNGCKNNIQPKKLIEIFSDIQKGSWIFSTWRSHWHYLLSGYSEKSLKKQIMSSGSMHIFNKNFFTSAIVGGISPIALGVAWALKRKKSDKKVFCFLGCMGSRCGISLESMNYAKGHDLPITFVIENNNLSVQTKTSNVWGTKRTKKIIKYNYKRKYSHAGHGLNGKKAWVLF